MPFCITRIIASHGNKNKETVTVNYTLNFLALFGTEYSFLHGPGTSQRLLYLFYQDNQEACDDITKHLNHFIEILLYNKGTLACTLHRREVMEVSDGRRAEGHDVQADKVNQGGQRSQGGRRSRSSLSGKWRWVRVVRES